MHELSVCQQVIRQVDNIALQNQARSVSRITLQIGPLSGIEVPLLKQAFPFVSVKTVAEHAELRIDQLPVVVQCAQCGKKTETTPNRLSCSHCGDHHTRLISGDEMLLYSVELEKKSETENTNV